MSAVNTVLLCTWVTNAEPPHCTTEFDAKPAPFTVSVKAAALIVALDGESEVTVGGAAVTVKFN
jgi:hypothetical protein